MDNFIEVHEYGTNLPISINIGAILSYKQYGAYCQISLFGNNETQTTEESYEEVIEKISKEMFINRQDQLAFNIGIYQYLDLLQKEKRNPLLDEYLKWKGMNGLVTGEKHV